MDKYYEFIVNPKARSGMGEMTWRMIEPELKKEKLQYKIYFTERRDHARKIAESITRDEKEHIIVVLGGDGTVNEVVNGIHDVEKVTFGYIPIGSGNDFARGLNLPKDTKEALELVLHGEKYISADVGRFVRNGKERRFLVSAGMGFDAAVCHEVCVSKWKKLLNKMGLGKLSYLVIALHRLRIDHPFEAMVELEDGTIRKFPKTLFIAFMNLQYEGGGFRFCPEASVTDGALDVAIAHELSLLKIFCLLPLALIGKHTGFRGVTILKAKKVQVRSDAVVPVHTDGEPGFPRKEVYAEIIPEKLRILAK